MKKVMTLLLMGLLPLITTGQNEQKADSIIHAISILQNDSVRINKIVEHSVFLLQTHEKSYPFFQSELTRIEKKNDLKNLAIIYELLAMSKYYAQEYDSAIFFTEKEIPLVQKINDSLLLFRAINRSAVLYESITDYLTSISYYIEADKIAQNLGIYRFIIAIKLNLGGLYLRLNRNEDALRQFLEAKYMTDTSKNVHLLHRIIVPLNLGSAYSNLNMIDSAIFYSKKSLDIALKENSVDYIAINYSNIGNNFYRIDNIDSAIFYEEKAYEMRKQNNDLIGECKSLINLILNYKDIAEYSKAIQYENKLENIIDQVDDKDLIQQANYFTALLNADVGKYEKAYSKLVFAYELHDSLLNESKQNQILDLETKYHTQQKENEILRLNNENIEKKAALAQSRLLNISGLGLTILLVGMALFFWQRKKQQLKMALLENSLQATELEKKRIGKELHDGIAGTLIKLVKDFEFKDLKLSDQLLSTYNEVRNLSHQLDNSPTHGEAFMERLIDLIPQDSNEQHFSFTLTPISLELKEPEGTHIYRIIQELIANNLKHADATKTKIAILWEKGNLNLNYEDNGVGITELKKGNGFKNIESRLELMKGTIHWLTNSSSGFKIEMQIPYNYHEKD